MGLRKICIDRYHETDPQCWNDWSLETSNEELRALNEIGEESDLLNYTTEEIRAAVTAIIREEAESKGEA